MFTFNLILWIVNFSLIHSMAIVEYPLRLLQGNRLIHASLTDKDSGQVWTMEEKISSTWDRLEGRIDVSSPKSPTWINVFYAHNQGNDNGRRLIMQNANCDMSLYRNGWSRKFPGVTKSLLNMVLHVGPSFFLRLVDSNWVEGEDAIIRGSLMHSATLNLERKLKVTAYYKGDVGVGMGVSVPSRIILSGYEPGQQLVDKVGETLVLDIYLQSEIYKDLSKSVQPTPGIGCSSYLQDNERLPPFAVDKVHFLVKETPKDKPVVLQEIHADAYRNVLRLDETHFAFTKRSIFDYNLGIEYGLASSGECSIYGANLNSPGIDAATGKFSLASLLWMDGSFQYLGKIFFEHRAGFIVQVWESVQLDATIPSGKYDKVVTSLYLASSKVIGKVFGNDILVGTTRNAYKKDESGNYLLDESIHRDYYDFDVDLPENEYEDAFRLGDCFTDSSKRLTLTMHLGCDTGTKSDCLKVGEDATFALRESLMDKVDQIYGLSSLRIVDVEFSFTKERIEADVTFGEAPKLEDALPNDVMFVDLKSVKQLHQETSTKSDHECLKFQSSYYESASAVIYCADGNQCISVSSLDSVKELDRSSGGTLCVVYKSPLKNLYRLGQEKSLQEIHDHILKELTHETFTLSDSETGDSYTYEILDVVADNKHDEEKERELFTLFSTGSQMVPNGFEIIEVPNTKRFSDCYRACSKSEEIFCETFSFCEVKDTTKCVVSSLTRSQIEANLTGVDDCRTYAKNYLSDYNRHPDRAYKVPISVAQKLWVDECAAECSASPDCFSFEFCDGYCTFGGYYTESSTKYSQGCELFSPKLSHRYEMTGSNIVTEVLHSELDLSLDQCAVFCFDYKGGENEFCQSFNYCPKSSSPASCQLTKYSVSGSKTATTQSMSCHNFELIKKGLKRFEQQDNPVTEKRTVRTTGSGAFGIVTLFLLIGLFVGFVGPYTVMKIKSSPMLRRESNDFTWSRQVNAAEEEQNEMQI